MLCLFKREFNWDQVLRLWEVTWSDHYGQHFHIFFALAILEAHRDVIIRYLTEFDEILKYVNELATTLEVEPLLSSAEVLYLTFRSIVEQSDRRKLEEEDRNLILRSHSGSGSGETLHRRTSGTRRTGSNTDGEEGVKATIQSSRRLPEFDESLRELLD